ncbi:hypothetical protein [Flavobacterium aquiphilum]|uniref:hypothetical protein n=1 Tax=Flavobacterium aquiphilum TaxID=3003261 RepID=UPI00248172A4|nr:hypothetical protein [Flavobacterium aquiphilum]
MISNKSQSSPSILQGDGYIYSVRQNRIDVVNEIIAKIASLDRKFFEYKGDVSKIFQRHGRLYMFNEYNKKDMCLSTKYGRKPTGFTHGGTLWGLTKDFKEFIVSGKKSNGENGYGGLYCSHWGYSSESMEEIRETAKVLGYL